MSLKFPITLVSLRTLQFSALTKETVNYFETLVPTTIHRVTTQTNIAKFTKVRTTNFLSVYQQYIIWTKLLRETISIQLVCSVYSTPQTQGPSPRVFLHRATQHNVGRRCVCLKKELSPRCEYTSGPRPYDSAFDNAVPEISKDYTSCA